MNDTADHRNHLRLRKSRHTARVDTAALARDLAANVRGEVRFDAGSRALYATDGSNYRQPPIAVVIPRDADDVIAAIDACRRHRAPVLSRGGGTSLAGQCCNVAVVLDMSKNMNRILEIDPERRTARVQPGVILDNLRDAAEQHHLTFAPDPATHKQNTLGGMIGNNSCGVHSVMGGRTADNIVELEVVTYDGVRLRVGATSDDELESIVAAGGRRGEIYRRLRELRDRYADRMRARFPDIPRRVSGFNLDELLPENGFQVARALVGSEGTCVAVLEATVRLVESPPARALLVLGYPNVYAAGDHVPEVMAHGPVGLEGIDDRLVQDLRRTNLHTGSIPLLPEGRGWLLAEFGGADRAQAEANARAAMEALSAGERPPTMTLYADERQKRVWEIRESGLGATAHVPGAKVAWPGWEDSAVPPARVGEYLRRLRGLLEEYGYQCDLYGHFGQGCIHTRIDFDLITAAGIERYRRFIDAAADLVVELGGSFSGEHGDGQARGELLPKLFGDDLVEGFREFKSIWDPEWMMNPGKVVDPYRIDENLRLGTGYNPGEVKTVFFYPEDNGSLPRALLRCVGVGKCRREEGGTMCPSYRVTREEKHTTRGRAHLLFEMLQGDVITGGWRDEAVRESLELCLACKGCKGECPVNVDLATYKAEYMHRYYRGRLRPLSDYAFGHIDLWSRLAARAPRQVNRLLQEGASARAIRRMIGIAPTRRLPPYADETFQHWFGRQPLSGDGERPAVILWPDTFNNHFYPEIGQAAVGVLESAGFRVRVPRERVCCGRPLYDSGMLGRARRLLQRTLEILREPIRDGVPLVVLEPGCASVFRDELPNLFPHDMQALRLARQTYLLGEFLREKAPGYDLPQLDRRAVVHGHCHHKVLFGMEPDRQVLGKMGIGFDVLDSGCCGLSGAFGMVAARFEVSMAAGERVLLPAVRQAGDETLVVTDGFSCREQILQGTGRRALHLAEVIDLARRERVGGYHGSWR